MTTIIASVTGSDAYHELVTEDGTEKVFHTYMRDRDLDRPATEAEAAEFWETARRCGGYVRRGGRKARA